MSIVIHRTPGLIPLESFTVFGMSAKPNSTNPIGKFGTGLKMAIAVLLRHDIEVTIFRGQEEYVFYTQKSDFRGKQFAFVRMKRRGTLLGRWTYSKLPFTTELGKHWELWMAFRELHANTLDEGGETQADVLYVHRRVGLNLPEATSIVVRGGAYYDTYQDRGRIFLPDGLTMREGTEDVQVLDRPSKAVYFRGLRVYDLKDEAQFTYNILREITLTEDRTAKYSFEIEGIIGAYMEKSEDPDFLQKAVAAPPANSFERRMSHSYTSSWGGAHVPTAAYKSAARDSTNPTARERFQDLQPPVRDQTRLTIVVPKPLLGDAELTALADLVHSWIQGSYLLNEDHTRILRSEAEACVEAEADVQF